MEFLIALSIVKNSRNPELMGRNNLPIQIHPNYTFSEILKDNQNFKEEYRNPHGPRIPEMNNLIPAFIDSFLHSCKRTLKNISEESPNIISTFSYSNKEYQILEGCTKFRKTLEAELDYKIIESSWPSLINGSEPFDSAQHNTTQEEGVNVYEGCQEALPD